VKSQDALTHYYWQSPCPVHQLAVQTYGEMPVARSSRPMRDGRAGDSHTTTNTDPYGLEIRHLLPPSTHVTRVHPKESQWTSLQFLNGSQPRHNRIHLMSLWPWSLTQKSQSSFIALSECEPYTLSKPEKKNTTPEMVNLQTQMLSEHPPPPQNKNEKPRLLL